MNKYKHKAIDRVVYPPTFAIKDEQITEYHHNWLSQVDKKAMPHARWISYIRSQITGLLSPSDIRGKGQLNSFNEKMIEHAAH